jgi:hypothetical protein
VKRRVSGEKAAGLLWSERNKKAAQKTSIIPPLYLLKNPSLNP